MDLSDLKTDVRERIGEDSADFFTDAEVVRAINLGQTTFTAEEPWPWLYTDWATSIAEGQDTLELPSNVSVHRVFNLSISGGSLVRGQLVERLEPQAGFRARFEYEGVATAPAYYYTSTATNDVGETLYVVRLVPASDTDYDVEAQYVRVPDDMVVDADVPDLPVEFHPALSAWAAAHLFLKEMEISQKAQEQFQLYFGVLTQARKLLEVQVDENVAWSRDAIRARTRLGLRDRLPLTLGP